MDVRVGLCGFSIAMQDYPQRFPVVEIQQTFYEPPDDATMERWRQRTGPALEYTMKVWQRVTHPSSSPTYRRMKRPLAAGEEPGFFRDTPAVHEGWHRSVACAQVLGATAMLFQCPASFRPVPEHVAAMRAFFRTIERPPARLLWEPRGTAWRDATELALSLCRELDLVHVVDPFVTPPTPDAAVYWRLHGSPSARDAYDDAALRALDALLARSRATTPAYVMFNNLPRVGDATRFRALLASPPSVTGRAASAS